ncbi:MAG: YdeI/OmpD-associated family protein [Chitinophagaceae bacterium]|nr:YdeI/OmpD-associated family protein [Chitinophagaceae bacterium]
MPTTDSRIDAYIKRSAPFAQPILNHLRKLVHKACPHAEETMKWSFPHFDYKGEMLCSMAAFKQHCVFGFWKASLMKDPMLMQNAKSETAMGHLGRITSLKDLPSDKQMIAYIKEAMKLNDEGIKVKKEKPTAKKELPTPPDLLAALKKNKKAWAIYEKFPPSHKKEYILWVEDAKREETRSNRIQQTVEWVAEGKQRNWKYM